MTLALNGYQPQTVSVRESEGTLQTRANPVYVELQPAAAPSARKPAAKKKPASRCRAQAVAVSDRIGSAAVGNRLGCISAGTGTGTGRCARPGGVRRAGSVRDQLSLAVAIAAAPGS